MAAKNSFVMFIDDYDILSQLNPERIGNVIMAVYAYEMGQELPELDMAESVAFMAIKKHLDVTDAQYQAKVEARKEAGRKSAEARQQTSTNGNKAEQTSTKLNKRQQTSTNGNKAEQTSTKLNKRQQTSTNGNKAEQTSTKSTDTVTDTDTDKEKGNTCVLPEKKTAHPTVDEVRAYCQERRNSVDAERFVDYYTANGWKVGKNPMKDWKAAVRNWERDSRAAPKKDDPIARWLERGEAEDEQKRLYQDCRNAEDIPEVLCG